MISNLIKRVNLFPNKNSNIKEAQQNLCSSIIFLDTSRKFKRPIRSSKIKFKLNTKEKQDCPAPAKIIIL